jgi:hypothetical protein
MHLRLLSTQVHRSVGVNFATLPAEERPGIRGRIGPVAAAVVLILVLVSAIYGQSRGFGLQSDDYLWIDGAHHFEVGRLWRLEGRTHFYRPVIDLYFRAAVAVCGPSAACFHTLNIAAHAGVSLLAGLLVASLSRVAWTGALAAVLFAAQPAPVEAVTWVSAVTEVLVTGLFVLTIWLDARADTSRSLALHGMTLATFVAALLTHESAVMLLPMLIVRRWWLPAAPGRRLRVWTLAPFAVALLVYGGIAVLINSQNYVITERHYEAGPHIVRNVAQALASYTVARRDPVSLWLLGAAIAAAAIAAPRRVRFFAVWTLATLLPFAPFHGDLSSRYHYLAAVGVAGLFAEGLWWLRSAIGRGAWRVGTAVWWILVLGLTVRGALFAHRNARIGLDQRIPYDTYVAAIRQIHPEPGRGARLIVPPPPAVIPVSCVEALLRWTYGDHTLIVEVAGPGTAEAIGANPSAAGGRPPTAGGRPAPY